MKYIGWKNISKVASTKNVHWLSSLAARKQEQISVSLQSITLEMYILPVDKCSKSLYVVR